jgi:hypothetical protein
VFFLETRLFSGLGSTKEFIDHVKERRFNSILVIVDKAVSSKSH